LANANTSGDNRLGSKILMNACEAPFRAIVASAGEDPERTLQRFVETSNSAFGFNAVKREWQNLHAEGVIERVKVVRSGIQVAVAESIAFLNSETTIFE
jgi:chaperonin GroEL